MQDSKLKRFLKGEYFALCGFIAMVIPTMIHTKNLLIKITTFGNSDFEIQLYAWFFAAAFDCSIFLFAVDNKKRASAIFASMSFVVGFMLYNMDILFIEIWRPDANIGALLVRVFIGTFLPGFAAYLLYYTAELFAERMNKTPVKRAARASKQAKKPLPISKSKEVIVSSAEEAKEEKEARPAPKPKVKPVLKREEKVNQVKELMKLGLTPEEISNETGFSRTMVYEYQKV